MEGRAIHSLRRCTFASCCFVTSVRMGVRFWADVLSASVRVVAAMIIFIAAEILVSLTYSGAAALPEALGDSVSHGLLHECLDRGVNVPFDRLLPRLQCTLALLEGAELVPGRA